MNPNTQVMCVNTSEEISADCAMTDVSCTAGHQYCPLSVKCQNIISPCTCDALPDIPACKHEVNPATSNTLIHPSFLSTSSVAIQLSAGKATFYQVENSNESVQLYDTIALQFDSLSSPIFCDPVSSLWKHTNKYWSQEEWTDTHSNVSAPNDAITYYTSCYIRAFHTQQLQLSPPSNIAHPLTLDIGTHIYEYSIHNDMDSSSGKLFVSIIDPIEKLILISPEISHAGKSISSIGTIVLTNTSTLNFVFQIRKGTKAILTSSVTNSSVAFVESCPSIPGYILECTGYFAIVDITISFREDVEYTKLRFTAANPVSAEYIVLDVLMAVDLTEATIQKQFTGLIHINRPFQFQVHISRGDDMSYSWNLNGVEKADQKDSEIIVEFPSVGKHTLMANISNTVSFSLATLEVTVYSPLYETELNVLANVAEDDFLNTTVTASLTLVFMSNVNVFIDFGDNTTQNNVNYICIKQQNCSFLQFFHLYNSSGIYEVNLSVKDNVLNASQQLSGAVTVAALEKVTNVIIRTNVTSYPTMIATHELISFSAETNIVDNEFVFYNWSFGDGYIENEAIGLVYHQFDNPGVFFVAVKVYNYRSESESSMIMYIQEPLEGLELQSDDPALVDTIVTIHAVITRGTNVTYMFMCQNGTTQFEGDQYIKKSFSTTGVYNVSVLAENGVSSALASTNIYVIDNRTLSVLSIEGPVAVALNDSATYTAQVIHIDSMQLIYKWWFSHMPDVIVLKGMKTINITFAVPGEYIVWLEVTDNHSTDGYNKTVVVQNGIKDVTLAGKTIVALNDISVTETYTLSIAKGSNPEIKWWFNENMIGQDVFQRNVSFNKSGVQTIHVNVSNKVSSEEILLHINVLRPIKNIRIIMISEKFQNDRNFKYILELGESYNFRCEAKGDEASHDWQVCGVVYMNQQVIQHVFNETGQCIIYCVVSSPLGLQESHSMNVGVESPITRLRVYANVSVAATLEPIAFVANSTGGNNLKYNWTICASTYREHFTDSSSISWIFSDPGEVHVSVTASNAVSQQTSNMTIMVSTPIRGLSVVVEDSVNNSLIATGSVHIRAEVDSGYNITFDWEIQPPVNKTTIDNSSLILLVSKPGIYVVILNAANDLGTEASQMTLYILDPIANLSLVSFPREHVFTEENVYLHTTVDQGTNITYDWRSVPEKKSKETEIWENQGENLITSFTKEGTYTMHVLANNVISQEESSIRLEVHRPRNDDVKIQVNCDTYPYLPTHESIQFEVKGGSSEKWQFDWIFFGDPITTYDTDTVQHTFINPGVYTIALRVIRNNDMWRGNETVTVEQSISSLNITCSPEQACTSGVAAVGYTATFSAISKGGAVHSYIWYIDSHMVGTNSSILSYTYVKAGPVIVTVDVINHVSELHAEYKINVTDTFYHLALEGCCSTVFTVGETMELEAHIVERMPALYKWAIVPPSGTLDLFTGQTVSYIPQEEGNYSLGVSAMYFGSTIDLFDHFQAMIEISDVTITSDHDLDNVYEQQIISFAADITGGGNSSITYHWQLYGAVVMLEEYHEETFTYHFSETGKFFLKINVSNIVSEASDLESFEVLPLLCDPPVLYITGDQRRTEFRSNSVQVEVKVDTGQCVRYHIMYQWTLFKNDCGSDVINIDNLQTTAPYLIIPALSLLYGNYCLYFSAEYSVVGAKADVEIILNIKDSALQALIDGGSMRQFYEGQEIILDGSMSYDPDVTKGVTSHLSYKWTMSKEVNTILYVMI